MTSEPSLAAAMSLWSMATAGSVATWSAGAAAGCWTRTAATAAASTTAAASAARDGADGAGRNLRITEPRRCRGGEGMDRVERDYRGPRPGPQARRGRLIDF